jgi:hypothetical protein
LKQDITKCVLEGQKSRIPTPNAGEDVVQQEISLLVEMKNAKLWNIFQHTFLTI